MFILAIALAIGSLMTLRFGLDLHQRLRRHQFKVDGIEVALPSQVYVLETNRWLAFAIPKTAPLIRLISNASVASIHRAQAGTEWPYTIEYRFLGPQGRELEAGTYHFKGKELLFEDIDSGQPVEVNTYLDRSLRPLGGRRCILNLTEPRFDEAQRLELRLHSCHSDILEVAVRVYLQSRVPDRKVDYMWNRLSEDQQRDLARGNVYSVEGLTEREKRGLLSHRWAVAAPEGIPGTDFESRTIFIRDDSERLRMVKEWVPGGIVIDADHRGVLPITNTTGVLVVGLAHHNPSVPSQVVSNTFRWHETGHPIETNSLIWSQSTQTSRVLNRSGFLEINAAHPISVRAFHVESGRTNEVTPPAVHVLTFMVSPTNSIDYAIDHSNDEPAWFRIDARRIPSSVHSLDQTEGLVRCTLLDEKDEVVQVTDIPLTNTLSDLDWLVGTNGLTNISVPQSLCFNLPRAVSRLHVSAPLNTILVNAYSRPSRLVKQIRVPEDYSPANVLAPSQPNWFTARPPDHRVRSQRGESRLVRVQPQLPEYDPLVQAGQYEWDSFLPHGEVRGQMLLVPPAETRAPRPGSLPFSYFPIEVNTLQRIRLKGDAWEQVVVPSLMLVSSNEAPDFVQIKLDGQPLLDTPLEAPVTRVSLGHVSVGEHTLWIAARQPVDAYLNHIESYTHPAYLQRFCITTGPDPLRFPYVKQSPSEETLALRIFSPAEAEPEPFKVGVELKSDKQRGLGPFPNLTLTKREAWITPNPVSRVRLVAGTPSALDDGQTLFIPVGTDMPPGQYEIEVTVSAPSPRWLSLSRTTPGLAEQLEFVSKRRGQ
jgi:hypothetical protein